MSTPVQSSINRIPRATYRLQLRSGFGFEQVRDLTDYLDSLGISDIYLSPLFRARKDSSHGYDVVDHSAIEPEFGTIASFQAMAGEVRGRGMGILLDVVPNHMGINDPGNKWWYDVLENGRLSRFAKNFDIDWDRLAENLRDRILLPTLGDHFGRELEQGSLQLGYGAGRFHVSYHDTRLPLAPATWPAILTRVIEALGHDAEVASELRDISHELTALSHSADSAAAAIEQRYHTQERIVARLEHLHAAFPALAEAFDMALHDLNGQPGAPHSFDRLEALLNQQWYRLANWRAAADEINYRRFFDINELAAIRVEEPDVFAAVHTLADKLLEADLITGLRIDHPDGLLNPPKYFDDLQQMFQQHNTTGDSQLYVVVEKILTGEEPLPTSWPVCGTTGYELLNDINGLLAYAPGLETLRNEYASLTANTDPPQQISYESKRQILAESMSSELHMLAGRLHRLSQRQRMSRDFTFPALLRALREVIACFPVYRTYAPPQGWVVDDADYGRITSAVRWAKVRNPTMDWAALDFIASVLLLQFPPVDGSDREEFRDFVLRFQQVTGPVTAKGIEDTAFYRHYPLAALNEVGGELHAPAHTCDDFHRRMQHRATDWPHGLSATATHDTKRGEDVRARLLVLSEVADEWVAAVRRWRVLNARSTHTLRDSVVPSRNEEYLLYQTLVGTWPAEFGDDDERHAYIERINCYMRKALREAKLNTSWASSADDYENAVLDFVSCVLDPALSGPFIQELSAFVAKIIDAGFVNSLVQVVLKATVPGVPDFYQGCELWDFSLVDPDNRRPVDYAERKRWLADLKDQFTNNAHQLERSLLQSWPDARSKLFVTWRLLQTRRELPELFAYGDYLPLRVTGNKAEHLLAFARRYAEQWSVTAVALHVHPLFRAANSKMPEIDWGDTMIELPREAPREWRSAFSRDTMKAKAANELVTGRVADLLSPLPVALLVAGNDLPTEPTNS